MRKNAKSVASVRFFVRAWVNLPESSRVAFCSLISSLTPSRLDVSDWTLNLPVAIRDTNGNSQVGLVAGGRLLSDEYFPGREHQSRHSNNTLNKVEL